MKDFDHLAAHRRVRLVQRLDHRGLERRHRLNPNRRLQRPVRQRQVPANLRRGSQPDARVVLGLQLRKQPLHTPEILLQAGANIPHRARRHPIHLRARRRGKRPVDATARPFHITRLPELPSY